VNVSMRYRGTCGLCGFRLRGVYVCSVRVNKASLRTTHPSICAVDRACPECAFPNAMVPREERWALDADSQTRVDAYRARKGWAPC
jgi:hypothetical protein